MVNEQNKVEGDFRCYEQLILCQTSEHDNHQLNIIIHDLPNAKCCNYDGKVINFGKTIIDAEVKCYYTFREINTNIIITNWPS
jgi:hypothetical protein